MAKIDAFLKHAVEIKASDFHLATGSPPLFLQWGTLKRAKFRELTAEMCEVLLYEILSPEEREQFEKEYELDFCYEIQDVARFRANSLRQRKDSDASFRIIPPAIPSLEKLGLPPVAKQVLDHHQGLILITGSGGQRKSTTLAAISDNISSPRLIYHCREKNDIIVNKPSVLPVRSA